MDATPRHRSGARRALLARVCALALAAGLLAGCGDGGADEDTADPAATPATTSESTGGGDGATESDTGGEEAAGEVVITIEDFAYELPDSVPPGAEITVRNMDDVGHTVTSDDDGATFDVVVGPGEEVAFAAPSETGEFPFHCTPHPAMTATLVVEGDGS